MSNEIALRELNDQERERLISRLIDELPVLRTKLGLSQDELAGILDISRQTYSYMETKRRKMSWSIYLALILLFDNNRQTHDFLRKADLFPEIVFQNDRADMSDLPVSEQNNRQNVSTGFGDNTPPLDQASAAATASSKVSFWPSRSTYTSAVVS